MIRSLFHFCRILSQSTWRTTIDSGEYFYEPVAVFKQINNQGAIDGASVQGFYKNEKIHKAHKSDHLKRIMPKSDGYGGFALNIGTPKRLIIFEAPIDMMSYYDLHKEKLTDVKLVACDGYKPMAYARYIIEILNPTWVYNSTSEGQQDVYDRIQKLKKSYLTLKAYLKTSLLLPMITMLQGINLFNSSEKPIQI